MPVSYPQGPTGPPRFVDDSLPYDENMEHLQRQMDATWHMFHPNGVDTAFQTPPAQRYGSGPGQTPYFTPGAFRAFRAAIWTLIFGPIMVRIGKNWYERTGDWQLAFGKAMLLSAMWKVWGTAVIWWLCVNWCINNPEDNFFTYNPARPNDPTVLAWCAFMQLFVVLPALGAAYCKLVDMSLFKHRFVFKVFQPIRRVINRVPWVVLISLVLLPIFFYIQMAVVQVPD